MNKLLVVMVVLTMIMYAVYMGTTVSNINSAVNSLVDEVHCLEVDCNRSPAIGD
jgi:Flp pilus assembly pilin Flp